MKKTIVASIGVVSLIALSSCSSLLSASSGVASVAGDLSSTACAANNIASVGSRVSNALAVRSANKDAQRNNENMNLLKLGQSKAEVVAFMGKADRRETYELKDGKIADVYLYRTETGLATSNEFEQFSVSLHIGGEESAKHKFAPLIFKDDELVGWGRKHYEQLQQKAVHSKA